MNRDNQGTDRREELIAARKNEVFRLLELTKEIKKLCEKKEPDLEKISEYLKKRQAVIEEINQLDSKIKKLPEAQDEKIKMEMKELYQQIKELDDYNLNKLENLYDEYRKNIKNINKSIKISNTYQTGNQDDGGQFIDTRE